MKQINKRGSEVEPLLSGYPTTDGGSTTRYTANAVPAPNMHIGTGFTINNAFNFSWVANGGSQKQLLWVPPPDVVIVAAVMKVVSMTTDGSVPSSISFSLELGDNTLATSGSLSYLTIATIAGADPGWSSGSWATGLLTINNTTWGTPPLTQSAGGEGTGWVFGTWPAVLTGVNHDRFYVKAAASGGTPAGQNLTAVVSASLVGYVLP